MSDAATDAGRAEEVPEAPRGAVRNAVRGMGIRTLDLGDYRGRPEKYNDAQLIGAYLDVKARTGEEQLSSAAYDRNRPASYPGASTIYQRYRKWTTFREVAEEVENA